MPEKIQFAVEEKNLMMLAVYTGNVLPPHRAIGLIQLQKS